MTYQRNIEVAFSEGSGSWGCGSNEPLDEPIEHGVQRSEVGGCDRDEDHGDGGGLDERLAVRPLHPLELGPAGDEEADDAPALARLGRLARRLAALGRLAATALALLLLLAAGAAADLVVFDRDVALGGSPGLASVVARWSRRAKPAAFLLRLRCRLLSRRAVRSLLRELVEVRTLLGELRLDDVGGLRHLRPRLGAGVVVSRALRLAGGSLLAGPPLGLSLCSRLCHRQPVPRSAGFLVRRMSPAPVAVLAQLDAVRRVAP